MSKVFKKCKTKQDLMRDPRLVDGVQWCPYDNFYEGYLKAGYQAYNNEQHTIIEQTIERFCEVMNDVTEWANDPELTLN
jgi:hypothetical protein